jgi:hypothetical protein
MIELTIEAGPIYQTIPIAGEKAFCRAVKTGKTRQRHLTLSCGGFTTSANKSRQLIDITIYFSKVRALPAALPPRFGTLANRLSDIGHGRHFGPCSASSRSKRSWESALGIGTLLSQCEDDARQLSGLLDGGPWHFADLEIWARISDGIFARES